VRAEVRNPEGSILPGQYIKANLTIGKYVGAIVVPEQAVLSGQEGPHVFVVDASNKVASVKVKPVDDYQGLRVLESGLEAGQKVIVDGIQLVRPGQTVEAAEEPLEKYQNTAPPSFNADPRFSSKVSQLPGIDNPATGAGPTTKPTAPESKQREPEPKNSNPDTKAGPDPRSPAPVEKKAS
jgi:membrane fusion protein (multidrug efflux system)